MAGLDMCNPHIQTVQVLRGEHKRSMQAGGAYYIWVETNVRLTKRVYLTVRVPTVLHCLALVDLCGAVLCGSCHVTWQHVQYNGQRM